jgi:MFS family permease
VKVTASAGKFIMKGVHFVTRQERTFKINMLRAALQNFAIMLTRQYESIYIMALGATPLQLGVVNGLGGLAGATAALPTGSSVDRHGLKKTFLFGTSIMVLGALLFSLATNWIVAIPAMIIATLAVTVLNTACPIVCGSCLSNKERATGMQLCDTLSAAPALVAPLIGAIIVTESGGMDEKGIRPLFYLQIAVICLTLTLILKEFTNPRIRTTLTTSNVKDGVRDVLKQGTMVKRWILFQCLSVVPFFVTPVYVPLFAAEIKKVDQFVLGGMAAGATIVPLLLSIPVGSLADKIGRKKVMYVTTPIYCLSLLTLALAPNSTVLLFSGVLQGFYTLDSVIRCTMTTELVPLHLLGRWWGILGLFRGVTSVVAPIFAGVIWSTIDPSYVLFFIMLTQILSMPLLSKMPETLKAWRKTD